MTDNRWLTKAEAAHALDCDERTIERRARQGQLGSQARPGFPTLYNPADIERLAVAKRTGVRPVVLGADQTTPPNGHGAMAHLRGDSSAVEGLLVQVLQAFLGALRHGPTGPTFGPTGPTVSEKPFLTIAEAAAVSGLTPGCLRRLIREQKLPALKSRGWRIRRRDLEQL